MSVKDTVNVIKVVKAAKHVKQALKTTTGVQKALNYHSMKAYMVVVVFGQHNQRKLLNFENWVNGEVSKSAKI